MSDSARCPMSMRQCVIAPKFGKGTDADCAHNPLPTTATAVVITWGYEFHVPSDGKERWEMTVWVHVAPDVMGRMEAEVKGRKEFLLSITEYCGVLLS